MEDIQPSRLQGAFINYLNFNDFNYGNISEDVEKYDIRIFILKFALYITSLLVTYIIIVLSTTEDDFVYDFGYAVGVWVFVGLLLFCKYIPFRYMRSFRKMCHCPWSCCRSFPTEERGVQTEENTLDQYAINRDLAEEQTLHQPTTLRAATDELNLLQHDEIGGQTDSILINKSLPSERSLHLRTIFGCPCFYTTADSEALDIQNEDNVPCQLAALHDVTEEQNAYQPGQTEEQTAFQPEGLWPVYEENYASANVMAAEKQLLQYLLGNDGEEESASHGKS